MNVTELIFEAWQKTARPIIYKTNDAKGNPLEVECDFLMPNRHPHFSEIHGVCPICGKETDKGIPSKKFFSANYTDWSLHKEPTGDLVCEACSFTMLLNAKKNRMTLSRYSFCASSNGLEILNRIGMRERLLNPPKPPFVMAVAVSQKKHIAMKSKMSYQQNMFYCNLEEEPVLIKFNEADKYINTIESLRGIGFTKEEISKRNIRFDKIKNYEQGTMEKLYAIYGSFTDKRLFELCLFIAQKKELEESECYLDLTQKTNERQEQHSLSTQSINQETSKEDQADLKCGDKSKDSQELPQNEQLTLELF